MRRLALAALVAAAIAGSGCTIATATATGWRLSPALATDCADHCRTLDMRLAAVVVIEASGGCVCEPRDRAADASRGGAAVAGGAVLQMEQRRQASAASQSR